MTDDKDRVKPPIFLPPIKMDQPKQAEKPAPVEGVYAHVWPVIISKNERLKSTQDGM